MKKLKITFAVLFCILVSNAIVAQEQKSENEDRKVEMAKQFKLAKEKLALSPEQETKFKEISLKYSEKSKSIKNSDIDKSVKRKEMIQLKSEKNEEIKAFLSETQFKTYLELQKEKRDRMKDKMKNSKE